MARAPWVGLSLLLVAALATAHVLGNWLGTALRDESTRQFPAFRRGERPCGPLPAICSAPSQLRADVPVGRRATAAMVAGCVLGSAAMFWLASGRLPLIPPLGIAIILVSGAAIGGAGAFLGARFVTVFRSAFCQARTATDTARGSNSHRVSQSTQPSTASS
jgi:hypothetical protein